MRPNVTDQPSSIIVGKPTRVKEELQLSVSQAARSRDGASGSGFVSPRRLGLALGSASSTTVAPDQTQR